MRVDQKAPEEDQIDIMLNELKHVERFMQFRDKLKLRTQKLKKLRERKQNVPEKNLTLLNCKWYLSSHNHIKTKTDITKITT